MSACCGPARETSGATVQHIALAGPQVMDGTADDATRRRLRKALVDLPGGSYLAESQGPEACPGDGEGPVREITVAPFALAETWRTTLRARQQSAGT